MPLGLHKSSRMPNPPNLIGTLETCRRIGIDRSTLSRWIKDGTARPAMQLPGKTGAYLFTVEEADRLAEMRAVTEPAAS